MFNSPAARPPLRVALIGFGAIGSALCALLLARPEHVTVCGVLVQGPSPFAGGTAQPRVYADLDGLLADSPDLVVECAGHQAVDAYALPILRAGKDLLLASVGALAHADRYRRLCQAAETWGGQLLLAPGAIGGLDILGAARGVGLSSVHYRSRKPPQAWRGTAAEACINLDALQQATVFFQGSAREAALAYPKNANVAASVALASLGFDATRVELIADPLVPGNTHEIEAYGGSGRVYLCTEGLASAGNPRTSMVTAHSMARAVFNRRASLVI